MLRPQVVFSNWVSTYGEIIVRAPQRAYHWYSSGIVSESVSYVVRVAPSHACHDFTCRDCLSMCEVSMDCAFHKEQDVLMSMQIATSVLVSLSNQR